MNASDLFVKALENEGVGYIYGVPGEENLAFLEALRKSSIKLILTRHEQGAAFMAATYGRLTGKAGVCLATLGPGATNFVTGAAYAQLGGMPLLMITGQKPIKKSKQGQFQIIDVVSMMEPLTKYTRQIVNVDMIPSMVREAFRLAQEERPGAVHLELPEDVAEEPVDEHTTPVFNISTCRRGDANERAIDDAVKMIKEATRPCSSWARAPTASASGNPWRTSSTKPASPFSTPNWAKASLAASIPYSWAPQHYPTATISTARLNAPI